MKKLVLLMVLVLAGCVHPQSAEKPANLTSSERAQINSALTRFESVLKRVEPVAEAECRRRTTDENCDYEIVVDDRLDRYPNAFQTEDKSGRPYIVFTVSLLRDVRNTDELALIMGHEAAHHIRGHLGKKQENAIAGAAIFGILGALAGVDATQLGADIGSRTYSKEFELEADQLGTLITKRAGYDPLRGAEYFTRVPDPGNRFLGTHPPNAARIAAIHAAAKG